MPDETDVRTLADGLGSRIEGSLRTSLRDTSDPACPPKLASALHYAVFPGGHRLRPQLALVAALSGPSPDHATADASAAAVELLHCASLVHDDLPCFDDAELRRGRPSLHRVVGEPLAILAGDALIVLAFQSLDRAAPRHMAPLLRTLALAGGPRGGIAAGQAWESEASTALDPYHRAKTASLFGAATRMGAIASGGPVDAWGEVGELVGRAYQALDDLLDVAGRPPGKAGGKDAALGRPNLARDVGFRPGVERLETLLSEAASAAVALQSPLLATWLDRFSGVVRRRVTQTADGE